MPHPVIEQVTARIIERSETSREAYLSRMQLAHEEHVARASLDAGNLAHGCAACGSEEKTRLMGKKAPNIAIVSAYNDMLSAHQPYEAYPAVIKETAKELGAVAQFAGGVPAMCDGITQGHEGMELSLFSRDTIAMSAGIALSHRMFDGVLALGICDKIVPGLLMGALSFAHLPVVFVPAGPMPTGISNKEKQHIRQQFAEGKVGREALLQSEMAAYHSVGTCTFYGTANSNQMLMEIMGLQLPGSAFVNPGTHLRDVLTREATRTVINNTSLLGEAKPLFEIFDERTVVNGIIGLLATGGSTNHTLHLVAIARAAGIRIDWDDFSKLSKVIPLLTRIYPNGEADINHFHAAGGMGFLIRSLLEAGLLHDDVRTITGEGLEAYTREPFLDIARPGRATWRESPKVSGDEAVVRNAATPFSPQGGLVLMEGVIGRAVMKISAVKQEHHRIEAPARVFPSQGALIAAFKAGQLHGDMVAVIPYQGPKANGMPELHKLTPTLASLQDMGFKVAILTDGRMSGASGKVPAVIHVSPEAASGGLIGKIRDGDKITLDATTGEITIDVPTDDLSARPSLPFKKEASEFGVGRELFSTMRQTVNSAEEGASFIQSSWKE
jgi:phosphogluconate dehydratase